MVYYVINDSVLVLLMLYSAITIIGVSCEGIVSKAVFQNKVIKYLATISMEIYLCHMFVYRAVEKLGLVHFTKNEIHNYFITSVLTLVGAIVASIVFKRLINSVSIRIKKTV